MSGHKRLAMHKKKAKGGKITEYNAKGSPEMAEAEDKKEGFKKGGHAKDGGHAEGKKPHKRMDKAKRGGHIKKAAVGGSPFTAAAKRTTYDNKGPGEGHEDAMGAKMDSQSDTER